MPDSASRHPLFATRQALSSADIRSFPAYALNPPPFYPFWVRLALFFHLPLTTENAAAEKTAFVSGSEIRTSDLRPTAGYYRDAKRFLSEIDPEVRRLRVRGDLLVRSR